MLGLQLKPWALPCCLVLGLSLPGAAHAQQTFGSCQWSGASFDASSANHDPIVLMVLSPRMVYSFLEWRQMASLAVKEGFCTIAARDPRVPLNEWQEAAKKADLPELLSAPSLADLPIPQSLFLNHAPTSQVWLCARAHPWPILGVMNDRAWTLTLRARLAELKRKNPCNT